ncbi:FtsK/SpoIIIE domain-containing protein [Paenarthrobacter sp. NPDC090522]|uniref:FtsK/SpoIIIE domain-containing protein n=1 Tax=Paenarthrobacter sp. NPDC090522 TaxID=3364383 RepID=UPI003828F53F
MPLECTLVRGPAAAFQSQSEELSIDVADGTPGDRLQNLLTVARDAGVISVAGVDVATLTVGKPPLVNGSVLVDGAVSKRGTGAQADMAQASALMLLAHSGPDAGAVFVLERGRYAIGRGRCDVSLPDPGMSRDHALLEVSATALRLKETSGLVHVDGRRARRSVLTSSSKVRCGNSEFSIHASTGGSPGLPPEAGRSVQEPLDVNRKTPPRNRWATAIGALLPLFVGVGLAVATGMWMFLGFTAISAASLLVPAIAGRKGHQEFRTALERAVREDADRRRRCSPSAGEISIAAGQVGEGPGWKVTPFPLAVSSSAPETGVADPCLGTLDVPVWLRLGVGRVLSNVRVVPQDPSFSPPALEAAPVTLDPSLSTVTLLGPRRHIDGLVRFMVVQLASFPLASGIPAILLGKAHRLPLSARFLDGFVLVSDNSSALNALRGFEGRRAGKLIILDPFPLFDDYEALISAAKAASWQLIIHASGADDEPGNVVQLDASGVSARIKAGGTALPFVPDLVSELTFDRACRHLAGREARETTGQNPVIPAQCSLEELASTRPRSVIRRWTSESRNKNLEAILGRDAHRPLTFDFHVDGPHLLIAGTTGSGKSELLRTLVASLALKYTPEHVVFIFIDFKGGSGLGPLTSLPHCVGIFTDLASYELERALTSLRAEIRYREERLSAAGAADLAGYLRSQHADALPIPHLMLVVDEFRMLVDEAPAALSELMRIATIGRSLGIHLVMATQRPQGALTSDIRANVTSSIALRVQSDGESMDIINSKAAAAIPVRIPGRAFLVRASGAPEEFQSACLDVSGGDSPGTAGDASLVKSARNALNTGHLPSARPDGPGQAARTGLATVVSAIGTAWQAHGGGTPRPPIHVPLPSGIPWDTDLSALAPPRGPESQGDASLPQDSALLVDLGLLDRPECQTVQILQWAPQSEGHLAMIGSGASGMHQSFQAVTAALETHPGSPHLYILDAVGMLGPAGESRQFGAAAGLHELPLAVRVLERLSQEMAERRSSAHSKRQQSPLVLVVAGWCAWQAAFRASQWAGAEDLFRDIVRDGTALGVTVLVCGERELLGSRFFAAIPNRAFFPTASTDESRFHWPRLPETQPVPGRAVVFGTIAHGEPSTAQFRDAPAGPTEPFQRRTSTSEPPFRIRALPRRLDRELFELRVRGAASLDSPNLWIGLGGDEAVPVALPLRPQGLSLVLGTPGSGKTSILNTLQALNPRAQWIRPGPGEQPGPFWAKAALGFLSGSCDPECLLLVDDADTLDPEARQALASLVGKTRGIIMTATTSPALHRKLPLIDDVQASRMGIVLAPGSPLDADILGVRLPVDGQAIPGRGLRISGKELVPFQAVFDQSRQC